jgi:hypothetical protein
MANHFSRKVFLKTACIAGAGSVLAGGLAPGLIRGMTPVDFKRKSITHNPLFAVKREMYVASTEPGVGISVSMYYVGHGCRREKVRAQIRTSDLHDTVRRRISENNGQDWSDWEIIIQHYPTRNGYVQTNGPNHFGTGPYDPIAGCLVKPVLQRLVKGDPEVAYAEIWKGNRLFWDHGFYQLSFDEGTTWSDPYQLKYENGPEFDPLNWSNPDYLHTNEMYTGRATVLRNGSVIITASVPVPFMDAEDKDAPSIFPNNYREGCVTGAICFIGKWDVNTSDYLWERSVPVFLPRRISTRGLDELDITEMKNGNLLMIIRGSNSGLDPVECPGRRWFSISGDGGHNWSKIRDIKYSTGESIYSPASISSTIRSSVNGKLYWIGNISSKPVNGNAPRYPLYIVEIDESIPAFKKETLTMIDDRKPAEDSEFLQLSNFSVLEDCKTHMIEIYLTRLGQRGGGKELWSADAYKYTVSILDE